MLIVKMIQVENEFKALVLDLSKNEGSRLVGLFEGQDYGLVERQALEFIETKRKAVTVWH